MPSVVVATYGLGERCRRFALHPNLNFSDQAICFHCRHFYQEIDESGECAWITDWEDKGTCLIGMTNGD